MRCTMCGWSAGSLPPAGGRSRVGTRSSVSSRNGSNSISRTTWATPWAVRAAGQPPALRHRLRPGAPGLMGMDGHSRVHGGESTGQVDRGAARRDIDADRDHVDYAGLPGAIDHRSEISSKRLVIEMHMRVE